MTFYRRRSNNKCHSSLCPDLLNIDDYLGGVNPLLLQFIQGATKAVQNKEYDTISKHVKRIRQLFILCQLLYCTNPKQVTPLHNMLADVVEMCGGSHQLIRILNRLGCTSSPDTHDRFVTLYAEESRKRALWDELPRNVFTIASVDNFNILQTHAAVFCGDQSRSYHGTTVQLVQPSNKITVDTAVPNEFPLTDCTNTSDNATQRGTVSEILVSDTREVTDIVMQSPQSHGEVTMHECVTQIHDRQPFAQQSPVIIQRRRGRMSPGSSPHNLGKIGPKRRRTVTPRKLFSDRTSYPTPKKMVSPENIPLKLSDFDENELESLERQNLQAKLFTNTMQKLATSSTASEVQSVSDVRTFLDCDASHLHMDQPSRVHYLELVDENPDSDKTMSLIAEDLLEKFDNVQSGWVVLVGDGKTYQHLMSIKRQYGRALNKLLIFPGDWHTLKNFQSVLMKIYYKAGLMELAQCSGYRGATLKSLGRCSNFKRAPLV